VVPLLPVVCTAVTVGIKLVGQFMCAALKPVLALFLFVHPSEAEADSTTLAGVGDAVPVHPVDKACVTDELEISTHATVRLHRHDWMLMSRMLVTLLAHDSFLVYDSL
jgi:hypothetical protein